MRVTANRMSSATHGENEAFSLATYSSTFVLARESSIFLALKNQISSWKTMPGRVHLSSESSVEEA